jgi:hypothetical protein
MLTYPPSSNIYISGWRRHGRKTKQNNNKNNKINHPTQNKTTENSIRRKKIYESKSVQKKCLPIFL